MKSRRGLSPRLFCPHRRSFYCRPILPVPVATCARARRAPPENDDANVRRTEGRCGERSQLCGHAAEALARHCRGPPANQGRTIEPRRILHIPQLYGRWMALHILPINTSGPASIGARRADCSARTRSKKIQNTRATKTYPSAEDPSHRGSAAPADTMFKRSKRPTIMTSVVSLKRAIA